MKHLKAAWDKTKAWAKRQAEVLERGAWTALQVLTGEAIVQFFDLDQAYVVPIAAALAFLKGAIAKRYGNGSAATLPSSVDPVPVEQLISVEAQLEGGGYQPDNGDDA